MQHTIISQFRAGKTRDKRRTETAGIRARTRAVGLAGAVVRGARGSGLGTPVGWVPYMIPHNTRDYFQKVLMV